MAGRGRNVQEEHHKITSIRGQLCSSWIKCSTDIQKGSSLSITTGWTVRRSNPGGARFSARPDRPWGPPSLLYNAYRVFPGGKVRPGRAADHSPPSSAMIMEEQSYNSSHPLGHNRACNGNTLPLQTFRIVAVQPEIQKRHSIIQVIGVRASPSFLRLPLCCSVARVISVNRVRNMLQFADKRFVSSLPSVGCFRLELCY